MNNIYLKYLRMIRNIYTTPKEVLHIDPEEVPSLTTLAQKHFTSPFLLPYMEAYPEAALSLKQQSKMTMYQYYQIEHFTSLITGLLEDSRIPYYLLKGISLAAYYPVPEYRKLGDVDLYIPDPDALKKAQELLEANGFVLDPELCDHHVTYLYTFPKTGRTYILELHYRIVGLYQYAKANQIIDHVFSMDRVAPEYQTVGDSVYPVLPPTEYTFYMLHHMLKHYLFSGFGIRLLCDFTLFLISREKDIDFDQLHKWCKESKILHFYEIIIECLHSYLGLPVSIEPDIHYQADVCETFILKILEERDMGTLTDTTLVGSGSYAKVNLWTYFKEGHLQMKVRFPKLHRYILLWPALWVATLVCFLWNTYFYRHTT